MAKSLYYRIGQACKELDIQPYVLRYWETEFPALSPNKSKSGQRVYTTKDLQVISRIKELLYEEGFTIAGAKKKLEGELKTGLKPIPDADGDALTADDEAVADEVPARVVDDTAAKELQSVRKGVQKALKEAQGILKYLDSDKKSR